jgi:spoIIIJ-associated protein
VFEPETIEAIGANVEEAIARGLDALNVTRGQVNIEVLDQGVPRPAPGQRPREARVRLTVKVLPPAPALAPAAKPQPPAPVETPAPMAAAPADLSDQDVMSLAQEAPGNARPAQDQGQCSVHQAEAADEQDEEDGPPLVLDIRGDDLGVLIGRRGETLTALQYLTRLIVSNKAAHNVNLVVDVEGYKARREQQLRQLAQRMAERVATTRKPVALEPMPPNERRIVHLTLRDHPVVTTESVGRDEDRKVTIILKSRRRS